jgi:hypothetical protein
MDTLITSKVKAKRYAVAIVMVMLLAAGYSPQGEALPLCASLGTPAIPNSQSLGDLIASNAGGGCTIDDKDFSNFLFSAVATGGATPLTPTGIKYVAIGGPPEWGFLFNFLLVSTAGQSNDFTLSYDVTCNAKAPVVDCITSDHLTMAGSGDAGGRAFVDETKCLGGLPTCPGGTPSLHTLNPNVPPVTNNDIVFFAGVHTEHLFKDIGTVCPVGASANCIAQISAITNMVDQRLPEPGTLALLVLGLVGLIRFSTCGFRQPSQLAGTAI